LSASTSLSAGAPADPVAALLAAVERAPDADTWQETFCHRFLRLREELPLHPAEDSAARTFEAAAQVARTVAGPCLPLGLAVVMHLYPLCALRCVPLPWLSAANRRRAHLLCQIDSRRLVLANAGSERAQGAHAPLTVIRQGDALLVDGTFDYVSLAHVADLVLFSTPSAEDTHTVFCVADLRAESVIVGDSRFGGLMQLSDTCSVTFRQHRVPQNRYIEILNESALDCMSVYQRSWFHLLLAEGYLARIEHLHRQHGLARPVDQLASLNELACLQKYALHLLNDTQLPRSVAELGRVTAAIKLRVSWMAQATASALRGRDDAAAAELGYIRLQPTSDERILRSIEVSAMARATHRNPGSAVGASP
jgi:alkylation response protein AidB-like acyl-CoA dehydrogenase